MPTLVSKTRLGSRGQPEESRAAILKAAIHEFAQEGIAGARTDAIAHAARVNKALLYYYFKDKEALYGAVLDEVFGGLSIAIGKALALESPPREKIIAYIETHFDYIASNPLYHRIVQGEMMRAKRGGKTELARIMKQYFRPIFEGVSEVLRAGISAGDFRAVDPAHFIPSMISVIVFYFNAAPVLRLVYDDDPMLPERISERRAAVLDFISAALFNLPNRRLSRRRSSGHRLSIRKNKGARK